MTTVDIRQKLCIYITLMEDRFPCGTKNQYIINYACVSKFRFNLKILYLKLFLISDACAATEKLIYKQTIHAAKVSRIVFPNLLKNRNLTTIPIILIPEYSQLIATLLILGALCFPFACYKRKLIRKCCIMTDRFRTKKTQTMKTLKTTDVQY